MKGVIFDFNGTMVFDSKYHDIAWKKFSKEIRGYEMSDDEIQKYVHGNVNEKIIEYLKPDVAKEENKKCSLRKEELYRELCMNDKENYHLVNGLETFLNTLKKKNIKMNIASASIKENIDFFISYFHLANWMDVSKIKYDDGSYINKVEMFKDAIKALDLNVEDTIVFEDSLSGIEYAKQVGFPKIIAIVNEKNRKQYENIDGLYMLIEDYNDINIEELMR